MTRIGHYYRREEVEAVAGEDVILAWDSWLDAQRDPGLYDSYKERDQSILPYVDGQPQWVTDVYMPPDIEDRLPASIRKAV